MTKNKKLLLLIMLACVMFISVPKAFAYFSTYTEVSGSKPVILKEKSGFKEINVNGNKHIVITAADDSDAIYVRVKIFADDMIWNVMNVDYDSSKWTKNGEWYEYNEVLWPGDDGAVMDISVDTTVIELPQFNVIVVYEYIPALSDGNGGYIKDWTVGWIGGGD